MKASQQGGRSSRRDLLAPLGIILVISGIVVVLLSAIMKFWAGTSGLVLVGVGVGLVLVREYRDEADVDYSPWGGLRFRVRKGSISSASPPSHIPLPDTRLKPEEHRQAENPPWSDRPTPTGCRLTQAIGRRRTRRGG
jgi:hypothetical protein